MKESVPKQFLEIAGHPIIIHTLLRFEKSDLISDIIVVCCEGFIEKLQELVKANNIKKCTKVIPGGKTRQESSYSGGKGCPGGTEIVLIHDAARPFVTDKIIEKAVFAAREAGAAGPVIDSEDTLVSIQNNFIKEIPDRKSLKRIQTPQAFRYKVILEAHERAIEKNITNVTDDCGLVLRMGLPVETVVGDSLNIKITDKTDLFLAERIILQGDNPLET